VDIGQRDMRERGYNFIGRFPLTLVKDVDVSHANPSTGNAGLPRRLVCFNVGWKHGMTSK
jgi:hypothetical protein